VDDLSWHHVAMTYDIEKKMAAFYLDGKLRKTKEAFGPISGAHCPLLIGSLYDGSFFYGMMDEVRKTDNISELLTLYYIRQYSTYILSELLILYYIRQYITYYLRSTNLILYQRI